ncbi:MAG: di-heme oxidoredictase family protein [Isosphaeraceae bacterium]
MLIARRPGRFAVLCAVGIAWLMGEATAQQASVRAAEPAPAHADQGRAILSKGDELFRRQWTLEDPRSPAGDGLGPVFNERSCVNCHDLGGAGGAGRLGKNIDLITPASLDGRDVTSPGFLYAFSFQYGPQGFEYRIGTPAGQANRPARPDPQLVARLVQLHPGFDSAPAVLLHRYGNDRDYLAWREWLLGPHGSLSFRLSQRNPTPLFGMGLVDAIPDEVIEAGARRRVSGWPSVNGRVSRLPDGRVGRYGWKAQTATLREFVLSAAAMEMGLHVPGHAQAADPRVPILPPPGLDLDRADCDALVAYVRSLPAPVVRLAATARESRDLKAGKSLFRSAGCAACHVPKLGDVEGLYSDLLLHEMASELSDTGVYGALLSGVRERPPAKAGVALPVDARRPALDNEWRTPPLWGLRDPLPIFTTAGATIDEAVRMHGGEVGSVRPVAS